MATQKRSSSGKRTTTGKKTTAGGKRTASPKKRPIRREVGGVVCLVLALCIAFSYFQQGGWLLDQPAALCRGLVEQLVTLLHVADRCVIEQSPSPRGGRLNAMLSHA